MATCRPKKCMRCGAEFTDKNSNAGCDLVCIPCLHEQGKQYEKTGDIRVFSRNGYPIIPQYERQ